MTRHPALRDRRSDAGGVELATESAPVPATRRQGRTHVTQFARYASISRARLNLHLLRLEAGGLVRAERELLQDRRAPKYFEHLPPELSDAVAVKTFSRLALDNFAVGHSVARVDVRTGEALAR